ncbi:MAG: hypothetical protein ABIY70_02915 [Capsulimonas sp.]|uniref:hypothetical protein n=1 Tax=Capsulimonas sp. TaxID=2494211 RepID=UPI003265F305
MANPSFHRAAVTAAALLVGMFSIAGCGGGGGGSSSSVPTAPGGGAGQDQTFGALTAHIVGATQAPVVGGSGGTVVTGVAGAAITTLQAAQSPSVSSSLIAFDRGGAVYTISPNGASQTQLTTDIPTYSNATAPSWSPNGAKIAYMRYDASVGHFQIYTALPDGTGSVRLTDGRADCANPSFSPNGATILFDQSNTTIGFRQIYSISSSGGTATRLSTVAAQETDPTWAPDGSKYAYNHYDATAGHNYIYIANANGSGAHNAAPVYTSYDFIQPAWSPDGSKIAFAFYINSNYHIYVISATSGSLQALTYAAYNDLSPAWSADGSKIAFSRTDSSTRPQIYVANADGTQAYRITDGATSDATPAWSPLITKRYFVGPAGYAYGTSASGFLFAQQGDTISSLMTFDAATPSGTRVASLTGISTNLPNIIFTATASDRFTAMTYWNGLSAKPIRVIGSGSTLATATDVVISFNSTTGRVASVLPYATSHVVEAKNTGGLQSHLASGAIVLQGKFLAAMDSAGANKAPQGASEIRLDSRTGEILSVQ